ncbi:NAD(P)H-quinone oxidoreductase [Methylomonas rapida]|uniref:NAD(P)H-quinone oxidoreductase n=1 Tax=Methylomonas rapida TaxID=2963939 RepID=A0ABY7GG51_9GAMM|nr:NAD(P)H-quinone oxidoreductase [Methylomonas rapida]WAR44247.1 NAD(P)H-quinone oxidoreductase [Methylomonas rapida]
MRAIKIVENTLQLSELPKPAPAQHQVLIQVAAAGVNRPDLLQRQGAYPPPPDASPILGLEVAGTIVEMGDEVKNFRAGDAVCALVTGGGYAEYCLASASCCLPIPDGFSLTEAAALPETFFTVWSNVFERGRLAPGETLLVHGGGSGIGTTAIQLAQAFGNKVYVTAGSADKCQRCLALGADAAIDYRQQDFVESIHHLTEGKGVDVILDMIGGDYFPRNLKCLATDGRLLQIAIQNGMKNEINLWAIMAKRLTVTGSTLRTRDDAFKANIARQLRDKVWPLLEAGKIRPVIDSIFPLADAEHAHARMASNQHFGKIILEI